MDRVFQARAEQRVFKKIVCELEELAKQTDSPVYEGDAEVDYYVKLSNVIDILQRNAPMDFKLTD